MQTHRVVQTTYFYLHNKIIGFTQILQRSRGFSYLRDLLMV